MSFNWHKAAQTLNGFGGEKLTLHVPKTGLPFYDALRLYGAIDLYIGVREDVRIADKGDMWEIEARSRIKNEKKDEAILKILAVSNKRGRVEIENLRRVVWNADFNTTPEKIERKAPLTDYGPDAALQNGTRDDACLFYEGLASGEGKKTYLPVGDAVLAYAGGKRIHTNGGVFFLPVFEGRIDLGRIVSPLRIWSPVPNTLLVSVYEVLVLITSLFAEDYVDRLSAVVFNTDYEPRKSFNYSGIISIESTALKKAGRSGMSKATITKVAKVYKDLLDKAYEGTKTTGFFIHALNTAHWILKPLPKNLSTVVASQEALMKEESVYATLFSKMNEHPNTSKDLFDMSYSENKYSEAAHQELRKFARAVAEAIYYARQKDAKKEERGKAWYDEIVMLRSAPSAKIFKERCLMLLEQGHKESSFVGSKAEHSYNPAVVEELLETNDKAVFEQFRDLFRMYLIQESKPHSEITQNNSSSANNTQENEQ